MKTNDSADSPKTCLECGRPLSSAEAGGLCARCLLKLGLASQFGAPSVVGENVRGLGAAEMFPFDFGDYRVLQQLGRGGMGAVYEAEHRESGRRVALKVLGQALDSPEMRKRFLREGRLAASVHHPHSVYIYGTEEIDGIPVIVMELVAGGTLRDRIKRRGPMPVREAVDAVLDIIAGLEAAHAGGVLHRDVKPANCFVTPDGLVKVGDFGLSVSMQAVQESHLTASGMLLGTPSFAPPEQLRGEELDVRADIYSVGATFYSLLTGAAPFDGENAVQVVAAVLDRAPRPIGEYRSDVPGGLIQVVQKCLAKRSRERFASYAELREALLPFSSTVPHPAPLGVRFLAGVLDSVFQALPYLLIVILGALGGVEGYDDDSSTRWTRFHLAAVAFGLAYFTVAEGIWGTTIGKALFGLRVVGLDGDNPGIVRAGLRALIFVGAVEIGEVLAGGVGDEAGEGWFTLSDTWMLFLPLLFVTMRARNGFAGLHELVSRTRTVERAHAPARPRVEMQSVVHQSSGPAEMIGPYRLLGPLNGRDWVRAYDDVLCREVWIRKCAADTPMISSARRDVSRAGRLRWLAGVRTESVSWDAYDAPGGRALAELPTQPWALVRGWLGDLTEELEAGGKDGTLPEKIGVPHVWITAEGRAIILDEPIGDSPAGAVFPPRECREAQRFLAEISKVSVDRASLPLHAQELLEKINATAFDRLSFIAGNLQSLASKMAVTTRRRRLSALALMASAIVFVAMLIGFAILFVIRQETPFLVGPGMEDWRQLHSTVTLMAVDEETDENEKAGSDREDWEIPRVARIYAAGRFRDLIQGPDFRTKAASVGFDEESIALAEAAVAQFPEVSPKELAKAEKMMAPSLRAMEKFTETSASAVAGYAGIGLVLFTGIGSILSCAIAGVSPVLHLLGLAVVDRNGRPAGRWRLIGRALLIWLVPFAAIILAFAWPQTIEPASGMFLLTLSAIPLTALIGAVLMALNPGSGLHDRLTGSRVVPR